MPPIIGIDLGTTNSLVGWLKDGRPELIGDAKTGRLMVPSAVSLLPDGSFLVGDTARERAALHPEASLLSMKRFMGIGLEHLDADDRRRFAFADEAGVLRLKVRAENASEMLTPPEASSLVLRELKRRAEEHIGEKVERAVITVPAYFDDSQRQATRDAGRLAGLDVLRLVGEPTAAALAYGLDKEEEALVAVFDLGGGTFDISILQLRQGLSEVLATGGDTRLGGDDFDRRVATLLGRQIELTEEEKADPRTHSLLLAAAVRAKHALSEESATTLDVALPGGTRVVELTRDEFEEAISDLVDRMLEHCRRALNDAGREAREIAQIILVGGSTRVPLVKSRTGEFFGRKCLDDVDADGVVAMGASIQAGILSGGASDMLLLDVVPLSLGIETMGGVLSRLIDRNTTIPAAAREQFTTAVDNQTHVDVHVLQGERELANDCRSLARFRVPIPPQVAGLPRVEITFIIDANGILSVSARDEHTNAEKSVDVKPSYGLDDEAIETMIEESFDLAEEDFAARQLIEARVEAETLLHGADSARESHDQLLDDQERTAIEAAAAALREACALDDYNAIRDRTEELNEASGSFAQRIMDTSIKIAVESRSVSDLVGEA
jgi:molecular chaperone DnaK